MIGSKQLLLSSIAILIFLLSSLCLADNFSPQVKIEKIDFNKNQPIAAGSRLVLTLTGKNLHQISSAKIIQHKKIIGTANLEKYTSKKNTKRRVVLKIKTYSKAPLSLALFVNNQLVKLPKNFKL